MIMSEIVKRHNDRQGSVTDILNGIPLLQGYAVRIPDTEHVITQKIITFDGLALHLKEHMYDILLNNYYVCTQLDGDTSSIYLAIVVNDEKEARTIAYSTAQTSIKGLDTQQNMTL